MLIPNLLITDDDTAFRSVLCEGLSRRGFCVTEAGDGAEAIELLEGSEVHVCLIDFHMPRVNGLEVMRYLAARGEHVPPCVLMSAELDEHIRAEAVAARAYEVLAKPIRLRQVTELVSSALRDVYGWSA